MPRKPAEAAQAQVAKRVTLQDIADVAGVTKMAVSNALNGAPNVSPAMREKIKQIAKDLNYIPNFAAKALNSGRTGIIAMLSGGVNEPYYGSVVNALEQRISNDGYHLLLMRRTAVVEELVSSTGKIAVDGAIAIDMMHLVSQFQYHPSVPCVSIGTFEFSFVDNVIIDLSASVREAIGMMIARRRRRIAYLITTHYMSIDTEVRARSYRDTLENAGLEPEFINLDSNDLGEAETKFKTYIKQFGCPEGLFCQNDDIAIMAFRALREAGYKVPNDVLLVGCDGQWHMETFDPPLSTIKQPIEAMCDMAWSFLRKRLAEPTCPHQSGTVESHLIVRESLGMPAKHENTARKSPFSNPNF